MSVIIGIRREDKNEWEKRTPLVPADAKRLIEESGLEIIVQPSMIRVYTDGEYGEAGCELSEDLSRAQVILGVKEVPVEFLLPGKTYIFFSHTVKGQHHNMPMLRKMKDLGCDLIDYEKITDEKDRRLIFFGKHAGIAGMIDSLWALGEKLHFAGIENPFYEMRLTHKYRDLPAAKEDVKFVARLIREKGVPPSLYPVVFGIAGYGNVSQGAQEILDMLPVVEIGAHELEHLDRRADISPHYVYKVVFKEKDMVVPKEPHHQFDLQDYYAHPKKYKGIFHHYLPHLTVLINATYWAEKYPRLITREFSHKMWKKSQHKLQVVGDISCDVNGGIEMNSHTTDSGNPVYMFDPISGNTVDGVKGEGFVVLAVDNLPCEISKESSDYFSSVLMNYIPKIGRCNFNAGVDNSCLPDEILKALILHRGKLTKRYEFMRDFLKLY